MNTPRRPPGRYDERRRLPKPVQIGAAVILGALLVGLSFFAFDRFSRGRVQYATLGYAVVSDTAVEGRFEVRKDLTATVRCVLRALDRNGAVVGTGQVLLGPSEREAVRGAHELTTTSRAATGEVSGCVLAQPAAP